MSLRFDWYPNYQHEVIISKSDLIVDRLTTKGMAQKTKEDLKRQTSPHVPLSINKNNQISYYGVPHATIAPQDSQ